MPTKSELAYIAGFFDGEGWISLTRGCPIVGLAQKDPKILLEVQTILGFGSVTGWNHNRGYRWRASHRDEVKRFIHLIYPHSRHEEKRRRMRLAYQIIPLMARRGPYARSQKHQRLLEQFLAKTT